MWVYKLTVAASVAVATSHERSTQRKFFATPADPHLLEPTANSLTAEGKVALRELLHDLVAVNGELMVNADFGVKKGKGESVDEFMPKCLTHVKELVHNIDHAYTDAQLKNVLTQECQLSKEFPNSNPSNFQSHEACLKFADKLSDARMKELDTGKKEQYEEFCKDYYEHAAVEGQKVAAEKKSKALPAEPAQEVTTEAKHAPEAAKPSKSMATRFACGLTVVLTVVSTVLAH